MKLSKTKLYKITKINKNEVVSTSELLERVGYIKQVHAGLFVQMHLMKMVTNNLEKIIREELNKISSLEIGLNQLQHADLWKQTGRYDTYGSEMFKLKDRQDKEMVFTGTNEELVTHISKGYIESYRDLPFCFYQINNKFRDEIRCNTGLIRSKEFSMMDAYSFHANREDLQVYYNQMRNAYISIFERLKVEYRFEQAESGEIGGSMSEEIIIKTSDGEIEIGHIFQLDTKYTEALDVMYVDKDGVKKHVYMGCYGIGISRLAQVLADVGREGNNLNFPNEVAPYKIAIIVADINDEKQYKIASDLYTASLHLGISIYLDDRDLRVGQKLNEADMIGVSQKMLFGKNVHENNFEMKTKSNESWEVLSINSAANKLFMMHDKKITL